MPFRFAPMEAFDNLTSASCRSSCRSSADVGPDLSGVKRGSLLKFISSTRRSLSVHYGVYIGDNSVVHLVTYKECRCPHQEGREMTNEAEEISTCERCDLPYHASPEVKLQNIGDMRGNATVETYNSHGVKTAPFPPDEIERRARSMTGPVNFRKRDLNCEHFATWCRYGKPVSSQSFHHWENPAEYEEELKRDVVVRRGVPVQEDTDSECVHTNSEDL